MPKIEDAAKAMDTALDSADRLNRRLDAVAMKRADLVGKAGGGGERPYLRTATRYGKHVFVGHQGQAHEDLDDYHPVLAEISDRVYDQRMKRPKGEEQGYFHGNKFMTKQEGTKYADKHKLWSPRITEKQKEEYRGEAGMYGGELKSKKFPYYEHHKIVAGNTTALHRKYKSGPGVHAFKQKIPPNLGTEGY